MPCQDPYDDSHAQKREIEELRADLKEMLIRLNKATKLLCDVCHAHGEIVIEPNSELDLWFREHTAADRERIRKLVVDMFDENELEMLHQMFVDGGV